MRKSDHREQQALPTVPCTTGSNILATRQDAQFTLANSVHHMARLGFFFLVLACSDTELIREWEHGQQRAVDFAWRLGVKPPSLAHLREVPAGFPTALPTAFANGDRWYLAPWGEEDTAMQQMRTADHDDQGHETPMGLRVGTGLADRNRYTHMRM